MRRPGLVLFVLCSCGAVSSGTDSGSGFDAGSGYDAGDASDGGVGVADAGTGDAGISDAGRPDAGVLVIVDGGFDLVLTVDTGADVHPISRYIYGKNFQSTTWASQSHLTMNRLGGNRWTAYNWENNASNAGADFNFQSDSYLGGGDVAGEAVRGPVAAAQTAGGAMLVTIPMAGWVAADKLGTSVQGQPIANRFRQGAARKSTTLTYPPLLTDGTVYQDEFVSWLEQRFPNAHQDPVREIFYSLDNEPDLWADTHSEIHPVPVTYSELLSLSIDYATNIKRVAPQAQIFGAVSYGYNGYISLQNASDAANRDFLEFFLQGMRQASTTAGVRLMDVLDLHWYPEARGGGVRVSGEEVTAGAVAARVQSPRSLWDPTYVESSWIATALGNQPIRLLPSIQAKIDSKYPGTKLAFSEYYFGGGAHISGAVAQADVLGIFGRENVFAAALWPMTSDIRFIDAGFRMFRNFDGNGTHFGDTSVRATSPDVATASVYASIDSANPDRVVVVMVNKGNASKRAALTLSHASLLTRGQVYQLTAASPSPVRGSDATNLQPNAFTLTLPAMSVTTVLLQP